MTDPQSSHVSNDHQTVRGATPADIAEKCLHLCQTYIGGSWTQAHSPSDIDITRITGGITNQLYRVQLKSSVSKVPNSFYPDEPLDVAVKLYLPKHLTVDMSENHQQDDERLNDTIVLTLLSQEGISPKVYGVTSQGVIQQYLEHKLFGPQYHQNEHLIRKVMYQLARVNLLKVPIQKNTDINLQTEQFLQLGYSTHSNLQELITEHNLTNLTQRDLRDELKWLKKAMEKQNAPTVFGHNDMLGSNILVVGEEPDFDVKLIDLEYASYTFRGFDLALLLCQYGLDPFEYDIIELAEDSVLEQYCQYYIDGCCRIAGPEYANNPANSLLKHVQEVKIASLSYIMVVMSFRIKQTESHLGEGEAFDLASNLKFVEKLFSRYNRLKRRLIKDGTIST